MDDTHSRRSVLALGAAVGATLAGCLGGRGGTPGGGEPDDETTTGPASTDGGGGSSVWEDAERSVSYDHEVSVENHDDAAHSIGLRVTAADGSVVHEGTVEASPDAARSVFDFTTLAPDDADSRQRSYTVTAWFTDAPGESESVTIEMDECHGNVIVPVNDDGELQVIYSIC